MPNSFESDDQKSQEAIVRLLSFGFKYGVPADLEFCFDVRFLNNPHYVENLKDLSGLDEPVKDYVLGDPNAAQCLEQIEGLITWVLPRYTATGKSTLHIAIGCTGGRHRSVAITAQAAKVLNAKGYITQVEHRDIGK